MKRYERFAAEIANLIREGTLSPGERIPSVRKASKAYGISPSTVFQAYYLLENQGLISARARSGYFVRDNASRLFDQPHIAVRQDAPSEVAVSELVFRYWARSRIPTPSPLVRHFPVRHFSRWLVWPPA